jgi:hypothetical protein
VAAPLTAEHVATTVAGVDWGCANVTVSPMTQLVRVTWNGAPRAGGLGGTVRVGLYDCAEATVPTPNRSAETAKRANANFFMTCPFQRTL